MPWLFIFLLLMLLGVNLWMTRRILASAEAPHRKFIFVASVWLVPFLGAMLVQIGIGPAPLPPSSSTNDSNVPWGD